MEIIKRHLCHDCGSSNGVMLVVVGKISVDLCDNCLIKREEKVCFTFNELDEQVKGKIAHKMSISSEISFDEAWSVLSSHKSIQIYDEDGDLIE